MNDKLKNHGLSSGEQIGEGRENTVVSLLDAIRSRHSSEGNVLDHLDQIQEKLKFVSPSVQLSVRTILEKLDFQERTRNTELMTAAIMAINPEMTISAANDDNFQMSQAA